MTSTPTVGARHPMRMLKAAVALAAVGYLAISLWGGWRSVLAAVADIGLVGILVSLSLSLVNFGLRFLRWNAYLKALGYVIPAFRSLQIYLAGFAFTVTPGSAGEAILRGTVLKSFGVTYQETFAAYFAERISDLVSVLLITLFGLFAYEPARPFVASATLAICLALLIIWQEDWLRKLANWLRGKPDKIGRLALHGVESLLYSRRCFSPWLLASGVVLGLVAWCATGLSFYYLVHLLGSTVTIQTAVFIYALSILAGALSFLPGGIGTAEGTIIGLLVLHGLPPATAIAAALMIRCVTLWLSVGLGVWCFYGLPKTFDLLNDKYIV